MMIFKNGFTGLLKLSKTLSN